MKALLIVALMITAALSAQRGTPPAYSDFDSNNDGKITQKEFEGTQQKRMTERAEEGRMMRNAGNAPAFNDIDTNSDGNIDKEEFQSHQAAQRANRANGQGKNR